MGASGMGGGGKSANVELNLVPLIDLFSTLICFLLITAVWQDHYMMASGAPPKATAEMPPDQAPQPPPPEDKKKVILTIAMGVNKVDISEDEKITNLPHVSGEPDFSRLKTILVEWKKRYPDRKDVILATDNNAKYKHLVKMMDTLISQDFPEVGINLN